MCVCVCERVCVHRLNIIANYFFVYPHISYPAESSAKEAGQKNSSKKKKKPRYTPASPSISYSGMSMKGQ